MAEKLVVGQMLWLVPPDRQQSPGWVTVEKIGRKWAFVSGRRKVDALTLESERTGFGHDTHGTFYLTQEEWREEERRRKMWRTIRGNIDLSPPDDISTDAIRQAAALLGITLPDGVSNGGD